MLVSNETNLDDVLQDTYQDHQSDFNWKRGTRVFNKTSYFALPLLGLSIEGNVCSRYLRNAYIDDEGIEHDIERALFVLFRVQNEKEKTWQDFIKAVTARDIYVYDYYVGQEGPASLYMYVFQVPKASEEDYQNFKKGRYSLMSSEYKAKFPQYLYTPTGTKKESRMWGILNKSDAIKDEVVKMFINPKTSTPEDVISLRRDMDTWDEVWDAPNKKAEIFHYNTNENAKDNPFWEKSAYA